MNWHFIGLESEIQTALKSCAATLTSDNGFGGGWGYSSSGGDGWSDGTGYGRGNGSGKGSGIDHSYEDDVFGGIIGDGWGDASHCDATNYGCGENGDGLSSL